MKVNIQSLIKKYSGQWIALDEGMGKVITSGRNAKKVFSEAQFKYKKTPFLFKVPTKVVGYIG